jgi:Permease MlaE
VWQSPRWGLRFFVHFARLVTGGTAIIYLGIAGCIIGFVSTYFTLKYMPYKLYTEPLLMEELLGTIGFALYRIFIPVLTTVLIAARCAAAISADLGNKRYGGQYESLRMLCIPVVG